MPLRCNREVRPEMYNPSYLIQSRHNIYYFRYPLPSANNKRVSMSLRTRCPKTALRLSKALEYSASVILSKMDFFSMNHKDALEILKSYFAKVLEGTQEGINNEGKLSDRIVENIKDNIYYWEQAIDKGYDCLLQEFEDNISMQDDINNAMEQNGISYQVGSKEHNLIKDSYKYVKRNYLKDVLKYNEDFTDFSFLESTASNSMKLQNIKSAHRLGDLINDYLKEKEREGLAKRSLGELKSCLAYLTDVLGQNYLIGKVDNDKARDIKVSLMNTPKDRNKSNLTRDLALSEQVKVAKEKNLDCLSNVSVNKYLGYFEGLFNWANSNKYINENVFNGIRVKAEAKKARRRDKFSKEEVLKIIDNLNSNLNNKKIVKNISSYWGALIAVYTGARRNEIAGLLPDDVKQDESSGVWYFDIKDEAEEGKELKTEAAKRVVPVHSKLIKLGFIDFVSESKAIGEKKKSKYGKKLRLLYDLTYTEHEKWGRELGRWFNGSYLKGLGLKTKKKTLHSLRHSFITNLSIAGIEGANIKSMVGHEPDTVTTEVYTHYGVEHLPVFKEAIEKLPY